MWSLKNMEFCLMILLRPLNPMKGKTTQKLLVRQNSFNKLISGNTKA